MFFSEIVETNVHPGNYGQKRGNTVEIFLFWSLNVHLTQKLQMSKEEQNEEIDKLATRAACQLSSTERSLHVHVAPWN